MNTDFSKRRSIVHLFVFTNIDRLKLWFKNRSKQSRRPARRRSYNLISCHGGKSWWSHWTLSASEIITAGKCQYQRFIIIKIFLFFRLFGLLTELCIAQTWRKIATHIAFSTHSMDRLTVFIGTSGQLI